MKPKSKIFYLLIFYLLLIFILKPNMSRASIKDNLLIDDISKPKKESSDIQILKSIREMIYQYDPILIQDIQIKIYSGIVSIYGIFRTLSEREKTITMIKTIKGVRGVIDYTILTPIAREENEIKNDIIVSFLHNPSVYAPRVKIHVFNGIVTLSGTVANEWEKEEALNSAKDILGVLSVKDNLSIDPNIRLSNIELTDAIKAMVKNDPYLFNDVMSIRINAETIILEGTVDTSFEKDRVEMMVAKLGIMDINNQLEIAGNMFGYVQKQDLTKDDLEILNTIKTIIQMDERIAPHDFNIFVNDGGVKLHGTIHDIYQKWFLEQDVLNVSGVQYVENDLKPQKETRNDEDITQDLERILSYEPNLTMSDIMVKSHAGEVILNGTIDSNMSRMLAERIAAQIPGIQKVTNHLAVVCPSIPTSMIEKNRHVSNILTWDMNVGHETFRIYVDQSSKTIIIRGQAKSEALKYEAERLLQLRAPDHFTIINEITMTNYF